MNPTGLIDKAVLLMDKHLDQIKIQATYLTKDGVKGFSPYDSQVIERYTKLLLAMTKQAAGEIDALDSLSDEDLEQQARSILEETENAIETSEPE